MPTSTLTNGARSPLRLLVTRCNDVALEVTKQPTQDLVEATTRMALLQEAIAALDVAKKDCQNQIIALTDTGRHVVQLAGGAVLLERTETLKRKGWRHADLCATVIDKAYELGQLTKPRDVAPVIVEMASISYWKGDARTNSGLFRLGIDKDEFCEVERLGNVQLTGKA